MFTAAIQGQWGNAAGGGSTPPGKPSWGSPAVTPGDGQAVFKAAAAAPSDVVYARFQRMLPGQSWSAISETFKRTGDGNITVTGLTNLLGYVGILHAKAGSLVSEFTGPQYFIPTDGSASQIDLIVAAIVAQINLLGLTSKDESGADVSIQAESQIPPVFESVDTPVVKVFYDTEEADAGRSRNVIRPRATLAFCQRSKTSVQLGEQSRIREILRDQFLGRRLLALPGWVCTGEAESGVMDMAVLADHFRWVSAITLEFAGLRAKG